PLVTKFLPAGFSPWPRLRTKSTIGLPEIISSLLISRFSRCRCDRQVAHDAVRKTKTVRRRSLRGARLRVRRRSVDVLGEPSRKDGASSLVVGSLVHPVRVEFFQHVRQSEANGLADLKERNPSGLHPNIYGSHPKLEFMRDVALGQ